MDTLDRDKLAEIYSITSLYEYENIQDRLNAMTEPQLESEYAHRLMDRAAFIRGMWRK